MKPRAAQVFPASSRHALVHTLENALDSARVPHGARVALAVSGGPDSMALLGLAAALAHRGRISCTAVHVNHGLRAEAADEGVLVERTCRHLGLPFVGVTLALRPGSNLSARARRARYQALTTAAETEGAAWVATAHHADDQFETMLMATARGTGLARMAGMRSKRRLNPKVWLLRPLLGISRLELRAYCESADIPWADDPTNADVARQRGVVRHRVVPELQRVWPGCEVRAARTAALVRWSARQLAKEARALQVKAAAEMPQPQAPTETASLSRTVLRTAALPVVAAVVRRTLGRAAGAETVWAIAQAIKDTNRRPRSWHIAKGVKVRLTARSYSTVPLPLRQRS